MNAYNDNDTFMNKPNGIDFEWGFEMSKIKTHGIRASFKFQ